MGGSSDKIKLAIIDEKKLQADFEPVRNDDILKPAYYKSLEEFLQNQSLKNLSYIIVREEGTV